MIQMLSKLHVPVAPSRDVEVALDLVKLEIAVDPAAVDLLAPEPRGLAEASLLATERDDVVDMLLAEALIVVPVSLARDDGAVLVPPQAVHALVVHPLAPVGVVPVQLRGGQDAVAGSVLYVDVQIAALHLDDHVEVDVKPVANAFLDGEGVCFCTTPPPGKLGPEEDGGYYDDGDGPFAAAGCVLDVLWFCLGWRRGEHCQ